MNTPSKLNRPVSLFRIYGTDLMSGAAKVFHWTFCPTMSHKTLNSKIAAGNEVVEEFASDIITNASSYSFGSFSLANH